MTNGDIIKEIFFIILNFLSKNKSNQQANPSNPFANIVKGINAEYPLTKSAKQDPTIPPIIPSSGEKKATPKRIKASLKFKYPAPLAYGILIKKVTTNIKADNKLVVTI